MAIPDREFGNLEARMGGMERRMEKLEKAVEDGNTTSDAILLKISRAEGGWKVLAAVASISAAIGGLIVKLGGFVVPLLR